jgi:hypothetical protein
MDRIQRKSVVLVGVLGALASLALTGCPKDDPGSAGEAVIRPDAGVANVIKAETTVPWGQKVACAKILDPVGIAAALGEAEVTISDSTQGGEQEATSVCSIRKTGKVLNEKEQAKLGEKTGFKIGVQPGDEICQLRAYCSYPYDIAEEKKKAEAGGQICNTDIGDLACTNQVQAGADYRYVITVLDPDARCRYMVAPTTITEEAPMKACAKVFVEQITKEKLRAP